MECFISLGVLYYLLTVALWVEKTHNDFADGYEYYYLAGDTATHWNNDSLRIWYLGSRIYSPTTGGLRIIGQDWDLDDNGWLEAILTSEGDYRVDIYWNSASGFNTTNRTSLFTKGPNPQAVSLCDLNRDGELEILIGERDLLLAYIHDGATYSKCDSVIVKWGNQDLYPADLNNDGEIDIVAPGLYWSYIYFGPGPFYSSTPFDSLYIPQGAPAGAHRVTVTDLNYDKFLDIIMSAQPGNVYIWWGSSAGWLTQTILSSEPNWDHSVADLNKDGYLDIFINHHSSTNDIIYYGLSFTTTGFTSGNGTGGCSIFDVNNDGELDIIAMQTNIDNSYIIWGPSYTTYISLPASGSDLCATEVADFDNDNDIDVLFGCVGGQSYLYWNNGGFSSTNRFIFPNPSNDALYEDLGNIWDRKPVERYLSSVFYSPSAIAVDSVCWYGNFPCSLQLWMRATNDTTNWKPWVRIQNGGTDTSLSNVTYLQYRVCFWLDYKTTSDFVFDSIKVFHSPAGVSELSKNNFILQVINNYVLVNTAHDVLLKIYDVTGREKKRVLISPGKYKFNWVKNLASGAYFLRFNTLCKTITYKGILIK